jgi:hypothetical protein
MCVMESDQQSQSEPTGTEHESSGEGAQSALQRLKVQERAKAETEPNEHPSSE